MITRPVQALPVVPVDGHLQVRVGTEIVKIETHLEAVWAVLRFSNGRRDRDGVIQAAATASGLEGDFLGAVVDDLERLGVLLDSRTLHRVVMAYSDNPMPYLSDMRMAEYLDYEQSTGWEPSGELIPLREPPATEYQARRSCRAYQDTAVAVDTLAKVLRAATDRPPSAGGLYPIRLAVLLNRDAERLAAGVYHYDARRHSLIRGEEASAEEIRYALNREDGVHNAPVVILIAGDMDRQTKKYSNRGWRYTLIEAGIAADRLVNCATAEALGSLVFGGHDDAAMNRLVFRDDALRVRSIVTVALGYPSAEPVSDLDLEVLHSDLDGRFVGEDLLVQSVGSTDLWRRPGDLSFHQVLAITKPKGEVETSAENRTCSGTGASIICARTKAIVECVEREASTNLRVDKVGPASHVNPGFTLHAFAPLTAHQIDVHDHLQLFNPDEPLQWVEAVEMHSGGGTFLPVDLVYYPLSTKDLGRLALCAANSSGVASHTDPVEAQHRALLELIERHAVLTSWHRQESPAQVPIHGWSRYLRRRGDYWAREGYRVSILDYSLDGTPVAGVAIGSDTTFPGFVFGSAASTTWEAAVVKAFQEAELGLAGRRSLREDPLRIEDVETPLHHGQFHAYDPERTAWRFLSRGATPEGWVTPAAMSSFAGLIDTYRPLAVKIDTPHPIHTVRVLSPRAFPASFGAPLEYRPEWSVAPSLPHFIA